METQSEYIVSFYHFMNWELNFLVFLGSYESLDGQEC